MGVKSNRLDELDKSSSSSVSFIEIRAVKLAEEMNESRRFRERNLSSLIKFHKMYWGAILSW